MGEPVSNPDWQEDVITVFIPFCEEQITSHQSNIRKLTIFSLLEILLGVVLTVLAFVFIRSDTAKVSETFFKLGPMFVLAPFPAFQYRMMLGSQQSLGSYRMFKLRFHSSLTRDVPPPEWLVKVITENMGEVTKPR